MAHTASTPEWMTTSYIQRALQPTYPDLQVDDIHVQRGSKLGDNSMCQILRINVKPKIGYAFSIIAKVIPDNGLFDNFKEAFDNVFAIESKFFEKVLPIINKILKNTELTPYCLHVDHEHSTILMDDLVKEGYRLQTRGVFFTLKQAMLAVEALASLHGASFYAIRDDPSLKSSLAKTLWTSDPIEPLQKIVNNARVMTEKYLSVYGFSKARANTFMSLHDRLSREFCKVCDLEEDKLNVLCHGDAWMNNMMFQYKEGSDVPQAVKLFDYQTVNYNSFANDLIYFLFSSVQSTVLVDHIDQILLTYTEKLTSIAPDIPNLTFNRVKSEFLERIFFGFVITLRRAHLVSKNPPNLKKIMKGELMELGFANPLFIHDLQTLLPFFE